VRIWVMVFNLQHYFSYIVEISFIGVVFGEYYRPVTNQTNVIT
jgi:hypothetical protein